MSIKLTKVLISGMLVGSLLSACSKTETPLGNQELISSAAAKKSGATANVISYTTPTVTSCGSSSVTLWAGQNMNAGTVTIQNTSDKLYVTYTTNSSWTISQTHLYVGTLSGCPLTNAGNPKIGSFMEQNSFNSGKNIITYEFDLASLPADFIVAAHAVVNGTGGSNGNGSETAWSEGNDFGGNSWATYTGFKAGNCDSGDSGSGGDDTGGGDGTGGGGAGQGGGDN